MKYEQSYTEFDNKVLDLIKSKIPCSFADSMGKGSVEFEFPRDREIELKVTYDNKEDGGAFALKFSWDNELDTENYDD